MASRPLPKVDAGLKTTWDRGDVGGVIVRGVKEWCWVLNVNAVADGMLCWRGEKVADVVRLHGTLGCSRCHGLTGRA